MGMLAPHLQYHIRYFRQDFIRMAIWRPRLIAKTLQAPLLIALDPFIASLPAHSVAPAQLRKATFFCLMLLHKSESFFHHTCLFPPHQFVGRIRRD